MEKTNKPEKLILVDENDNPIGIEEKLKAHQEGKLHRCFSIFIFNDKHEIMLQQRASRKYHSGGLWTNTVCGHPRPGEQTEAAAHRRLKDEMGFDCELKEIFTFLYRADLDHDLIEHEFDHVFVGSFNDDPKINPDEADAWKWVSPEDALKDIKNNPKNYTYWFTIAFEKVLNHLKS